VKRLIAFASLVALATSATAVPAAETTHHAKSAAKPAVKKKVAVASCHVAPADEYFGKLKMSVLGIRNTIRDQGMQIDVDSAKTPQALGKVNFAEDALHDWERKYSCDRWIPWTIYALEHFYGKIHTADGVKNVNRVVAWLKHDYPKSGGVINWALKDQKTAVAALTATPAPSPSPIAVDAVPASLSAPAAAAPSPAPSANP
jgi:hypothetical protein